MNISIDNYIKISISLSNSANTSTNYNKLFKLIIKSQLSNDFLINSLYYLYLYQKNSLSQYQVNANDNGFNVNYITIIISLVLSQKYLDDQSYTLKTWSNLSNISLVVLNKNERRFLDVLKFNLNLHYTNEFYNILNLFNSNQRIPTPIHNNNYLPSPANSPKKRQQDFDIMELTNKKIKFNNYCNSHTVNYTAQPVIQTPISFPINTMNYSPAVSSQPSASIQQSNMSNISNFNMKNFHYPPVLDKSYNQNTSSPLTPVIPKTVPNMNYLPQVILSSSQPTHQTSIMPVPSVYHINYQPQPPVNQIDLKVNDYNNYQNSHMGIGRLVHQPIPLPLPSQQQLTTSVKSLHGPQKLHNIHNIQNIQNMHNFQSMLNNHSFQNTQHFQTFHTPENSIKHTYDSHLYNCSNLNSNFYIPYY